MHLIAFETALSIINLTSRNKLVPFSEFSCNFNFESYPVFYAELFYS